jgi:hypothetical protein
MASVRRQIFDAIAAKLEAVRDRSRLAIVLRNPRKPVGEDQMNAIVLGEGGEPEPDDLTGHVEINVADFEVGMVVMETGAPRPRTCSTPASSRSATRCRIPAISSSAGWRSACCAAGWRDRISARRSAARAIVGVQTINFSVQYMAREGDASTPGP